MGDHHKQLVSYCGIFMTANTSFNIYTDITIYKAFDIVEKCAKDLHLFNEEILASLDVKSNCGDERVEVFHVFSYIGSKISSNGSVSVEVEGRIGLAWGVNGV